jgi:hypothetical protein
MSAAKTATVRETQAWAGSPDPVGDRLHVLAEMLVYGASRQDILDLAQRRWGVSRRTAQDYLHTVRQRLAGEAADEDRLFALRLSQLQRDKLVGLALRYTQHTKEEFDPKVLQSLAAMITAVRGLLDSRDRTAAEIHQLVAEQVRKAENAGPPPHQEAIPETEAPRPAPPVNGCGPAVPVANGKSRPPREHRRAAANGVTHELGNGTSVPLSASRTPLPAVDLATDQGGGGYIPNLCADQRIGQEAGESRGAEASCASCAGAT